MEGLNIARRYAQSLIELAQERNEMDAVLEDMKFILVAANDNRDFRSFLKSPLIKEDKKESVFKAIFSDSTDLTIKFSALLIKNSREFLLPVIAEQFVQKVNEARGIVPLTLISAVELDAKVRDEIIAKINSSIQGEIELTERTDASIMGGFVVEMADTRIDASVAHQLNKIKQRLLK